MFCKGSSLSVSPCRLYCPNALTHFPHCSCHTFFGVCCCQIHLMCWWFLAHRTWCHVFLTCYMWVAFDPSDMISCYWHVYRLWSGQEVVYRLFNYHCPHVVSIVLLHSVIFSCSSCSYMIRYMLLSDTSDVSVVPGTLDMTSCVHDMWHVGGIWRSRHDLMLLACVSFVYHFMTCFVLFSVLAPLYNHLSPTTFFPKHMHSCHWYQHDHTCWWVLVHGTWHDVLSPFSVLAPLYTHESLTA